MEANGFVKDFDLMTGLMVFMHEDFKIEFITDAGAKSAESIHSFKNLNLNAQELRFMSIPLSYNYVQPFRDIEIRLPEPEAFACLKRCWSQFSINVTKSSISPIGPKIVKESLLPILNPQNLKS